jgi:16S rRNA (cytidine1402-2'-O)-methyltransferase
MTSAPEAQGPLTPRLGALYLVPTPLDFGCHTAVPLTEVLPPATIELAASIENWVCENAKSARAFLKRVGEVTPLSANIQMQNLQELPREVHKKGDLGFDARSLLAPALQGQAMGLLSEAGMPAIADPGASVVRAAHTLGISVRPLVGPISLMLALAASGLNGQNFAFVGYVPSDSAARAQRIKTLEALALKTGQTQLFIETPYRNEALLQTLLDVLQASTRLAVSMGLTLEQGQHYSGPVSTWKRARWALNKQTPAVFAIGP